MAESKTEDLLKKRAEAQGMELEKVEVDVLVKEDIPDEEKFVTEEDLIEEDTLPEPEIGPEEVTVDEVYEEPEARPMINEHSEIYHVMRTVGRSENRELGILTGASFDREISSYLESGFEVIDVLAAGYSADGDRILFILGRRADGEVSGFKEMHLIKRTIGVGQGAVSGFSADLWLNHHIQDLGWKLYRAMQNGAPPEGINMLWILLR